MTEDLRLHCVEIQRIANLVLGQCDGAKEADGLGFSRGDLTIGRALAIAPIHLWSEKLAGKGAHMLLRHRRQIPEETARLQSICHVLPDPVLMDTPVPAIVTQVGNKLIIASEPIGTSEANRKEFSKMAKALGFVPKPDGNWILECEFDLSRVHDPIEKLAKLGWYVLPEAKGYLDSYLAHVRLHAETLRKTADATRPRDSEVQYSSHGMRGENSPGFIDRIMAQFNPKLYAARRMQLGWSPPESKLATVRFEKRMTESGKIVHALIFWLPPLHAPTAEILAAYQDQLVRSHDDPACFVLENPRDADILLVKENARAWGIAGVDALPNG